MSAYQSIRDEVLKKLDAHSSELCGRFGIERLYLFGSVSRGEDTQESDIDLAYTRIPGKNISLFQTVDLIDHLEDLLGRKVDLIPLNQTKPLLRRYIERDMIECFSEPVQGAAV